MDETSRLDGSRLPLQSLRRITGQVFWTIVDQGLLGLSNFGANLVLARWLTPGEYGGYAAASAVFWLVGGAHGGVLTDPMMVFGSGRFRDRLSSYFAVLAVIHWCVSAMIAVGLAAAGLALLCWGSKASGAGMLGYAAAAPVILFQLLFRRTFYVQLIPRLAAIAGGVYLVGMFAIMYLLYRSAALSAFTAPLAAAGASVLAIGGIMAMGHVKLWSPRQGGFMRQVATAHWRYGRWSLVTAIVSWAPGSLYYLIVPSLVGLDANGALNALIILTVPAAQVYMAFTFLLVPTFGRMRRRGSAAPLVWKALGVLVASACLYALLIFMFGQPLMDLLYRGRYTQYARFAWLIGLIAPPTAAIAVLGSVLRACERPDRVFWAYVMSTAVTCVFGVAAVAIWGLLGAVLGLLGGYVTTMLAMLWWVLRTDAWPQLRTATVKPV
jgi:O-antigen/teichoic acid export membrane protein